MIRQKLFLLRFAERFGKGLGKIDAVLLATDERATILAVNSSERSHVVQRDALQSSFLIDQLTAGFGQQQGCLSQPREISVQFRADRFRVTAPDQLDGLLVFT